MLVEHHVQIPMRDGTALSADVYRGDTNDPGPTVLIRTCYTKAVGAYPAKGAFWVTHGYRFVVQDVRGRGDSQGSFYPLVHEMDDGSDTLDWIASQPWSDGRVLMCGGSYLGWVQLYAACSGNQHLVALVPTTTPPDPDRGFPLSFGMVLPTAACWLATLDGHTNQDLSRVDLARVYAHRPMIDVDQVLGRKLPVWKKWLQHPRRDAYWERQSYQERLLASTQPMLHVTGWYDDCLNGALQNFAALTARAHSPAQRLLVGPWLHGTIGQRKIGATDYGAAAELDVNELQRDWFDACLRGRPPEGAPVRLFVMGRNTWIEEQQWPIARTEYVPYYLHSRGRANTRHGDGFLSELPPTDEPVDTYQYDPDDPVPYSPNLDWRQVGGPDDCADLELREDILVYTGPTLQEPLVICGPLRLKLFAATTARDTDWTAKILDVHPDGKAIRLNDGAVRARFRMGHDREVLVTPGLVDEYTIDCWATCIELAPGHRLRLELSSSALGKYDVNPNGPGPVAQQSTAVVAHQTVYHDSVHPSHLALPLLRDI